MYAYVLNNIVERQGRLPKTWTLKDGRTVSGYNLLDEEILKQEGWLPLEDIQPEYNNEKAINNFALLMDIIRSVRNIRAEVDAPMSKQIRMAFSGLEHVADFNLAPALSSLVKKIQKTDEVHLSDKGKYGYQHTDIC